MADESRSPSRAPEDREPEPQREQGGSRPPSRSNPRGRSRSSRPVSRSWSQGPSEASADEDSPTRRTPRRRKNRKGQQGSGLPAVDEVQDTTQQVTKGTAGNVLQGGGGEEKKDDEDGRQISLRLDLNLDVQLELRAKVHGDLTLALLEG